MAESETGYGEWECKSCFLKKGWSIFDGEVGSGVVLAICEDVAREKRIELSCEWVRGYVYADTSANLPLESSSKRG